MLTVFDMATGHIIEQSPARQAKAQTHSNVTSAPKEHPPIAPALQTVAEAAPRDANEHLHAQDCLKELLRDTE